MDPDTKANTQGGGALERGHGAPFEPLTQLGDALGRVGAVASEAEAAELVPRQTAHVAVSMGAGTGKADTRGVTTHLSQVMALPLSPSQSAAMPSAL